MLTTNKVIKLIKEMMTANPPGGGGGFSSNPSKPGVDGFDPFLDFKRRGKIDFRKVNKKYRHWVKDLNNK
jgi:hypothetical protein